MARRQPTSNVLTRYVPRVALEWDERLAWRALDGSLVFVDISGFTALSERLARQGRVGAEELTATLSRCFGDLLGVAYEAGGSLLKFGGDALLLLFEGDGHPERACASALRTRATMADIGRVATSVGTVRLRMSVGVHSGDLHLFRVGRSHRELIVTGPGATATVEMEGTASAGQIVVSPGTAARVDPRLIGTRLGPGFLLRRREVAIKPGDATRPVRADADVAAASVPVALRSQLLDGLVEPEHRHVSIAFVHYDGVDRRLADAGPTALAGDLEELVADVQDAAADHGVTFLATDVDKDGGKIILVAGAPRALGDDEGRMLRCLRTIADGRRALPVRIGVNHGPVFVGEVGPAYRRTYTVMGDAVNLAARLMAKARSGQVLATAAVLDHSATEFDASALPPFMVKGKSQPVQAFAVGAMGMRRDEHHAHRSTLVGRRAELSQLCTVLDSALAGQGATVELQGSVGIGKSRLIEEACARAHGFTVVRSFCEPYESKTPYYAFRFLLRAMAGVDCGGEAGGRQLAARVAEVAPALTPWLPLLATVADVNCEPTREVDDLEPRFRRQRTRHVVVDLLAALVTTPLAAVIEDVQWIDALSAELLEAVATDAGRRPWALFVARRLDADDEPPAVSDHTVALPVGPINDDAAAALVAEAAGDTPLLPHERDLLVARAGGNPLFLEELIRARRSGTADEPLPDSLEAVVATQIDRLAPAERRLLRYTSVLGPIFDAALLPAVTDGVIRTASAAVRRFSTFLEPAGPGLVRFRNQCHREVAYDALSFRRRRELHARVGEALEQAGAGTQADRAGTLSFHFLHAQRYESCWRYARVGAEHASAAYANVEAAALYERALSTVRHLDDVPAGDVASTWECLGDVALLTGAFDRARHAYGQARRLRSDDPVKLAVICAREYRATMHQGRSANAVRWLRRGLRLLDDVESVDGLKQRAHLRYLYAHSRQQAGRPADALHWCALAQADAERSGDRTALASAYVLQDWALLAVGRPAEATNAPRALAICEEGGDLIGTAEALLYMGNFALLRSRWNEALDLFTRAQDAYLRTGNTIDAAFGACNSAEILLFQGRYDEAEATLRSALEFWRSMGYSNGEGQALIVLGRLSLYRGDVVEATHVFEEARAMFGPAGDVRELDALGGLAECRLREGELGEALVLADDALRRQATSGDTTFAAMLHRVRAYALAALDRLADAWAAVDESLAVARASGAAYEVALTLEALSVVAELGGLPHDESADVERASLLEQLGIETTPPPPLQVAA